MPSTSATIASLSGEMKPCAPCRMARQAITADAFCSSGYLAISRSKPFGAACDSMALAGTATFMCAPLAPRAVPPSGLSPPPGGRAERSSIDLPEYDVHRADDGDGIGDHVAARHLVERREVRKAGRADLQPIRLVCAVAHDVDAELALRMLDSGIRFALGHAEALGEELEMVDQVLHSGLHVDARRRRDLVVRRDHRPGMGLQ